MKIFGRYFLFIAACLLIHTSEKVTGIYVEKVLVPEVVVAGKTVELQCLYREEGDELYSLKWWRGEDHFYQYIPPKRSFYSTPGVRVNMSATYSVNKLSPPGLERVVLDSVGLDSAGVYKCEVMADKIFQTVHKAANMTVIYPPSGPPTITGVNKEHKTVISGQRIALMCSVPPANPAPIVTWKINNRLIHNNDWVTHHPSMYSGGLSQVVSSLDFVVTPKMLDESVNGLRIECDTRQPKSSYYQRDTVVFFPERGSYFWFFSQGVAPQSTMKAVVGLAVVSEIVRRLQ